jgi:hypothetical protein
MKLQKKVTLLRQVRSGGGEWTGVGRSFSVLNCHFVISGSSRRASNEFEQWIEKQNKQKGEIDIQLIFTMNL